MTNLKKNTCQIQDYSETTEINWNEISEISNLCLTPWVIDEQQKNLENIW